MYARARTRTHAHTHTQGIEGPEEKSWVLGTDLGDATEEE